MRRRIRPALLLLLGLGAPACGAAAQGGLGDGRRQPLVYVANQESATISVIEVGTNAVVATVDLVALGFPMDSKPHHTAVEPDGGFWYASLIAAGKVLKFDRDNRLVGQADFETPGMLALHPSQDLLYVGRSMAAVNPPQRIGVVRRSDMSLDEIDVFFPRPHAVAVHPDGNTVYAASLAVNQLAAVDVASDDLELITLEGDPHVLVQFAVSPDGARLVATGQLTGTLLVFDATNPMRPALIRAIDVNAAPWHPAFTPDGRFVYFGNQGANTVTVVAADTWTVADVIEGEGLAEPHGIAVSPDGRWVYVSSRNLQGTYAGRGADPRPGTVAVIDTSTRTITAVIEVGRYAAGMSTRSDP